MKKEREILENIAKINGCAFYIDYFFVSTKRPLPDIGIMTKSHEAFSRCVFDFLHATAKGAVFEGYSFSNLRKAFNNTWQIEREGNNYCIIFKGEGDE